MNAKKTTKKKTAAKKTAKVMDDAINTIIETAPTFDASHEVFDEDDYDPYAPNNTVENWSDELSEKDQEIVRPLAIEPVVQVSEPKLKPETEPQKSIPKLEGDALIIDRLINAINFLYGKLKESRGDKKIPKETLDKISINIGQARLLVNRRS